MTTNTSASDPRNNGKKIALTNMPKKETKREPEPLARKPRSTQHLENKALSALSEMLEKSAPPAVRLKATIWTLESLGYGKGPPPDQGMENLTADELRALIDAADAGISALADNAKPVIDVARKG